MSYGVTVELEDGSAYREEVDAVSGDAAGEWVMDNIDHRLAPHVLSYWASPIYRCTVCQKNQVDAENGFDTCGDCHG